jgi:hypothetical protein
MLLVSLHNKSAAAGHADPRPKKLRFKLSKPKTN